jgi:O-succinylbenzoic acid--CoA ligase
MDLEAFLDEWHNDSPTVMVHTSGSTGAPKPMLVEKRRMEASARITCGFLGLKAGDTALLCMSLDYIAGKMMVVRALTCGLKLIAVKPCGCPEWEGDIDFAAMVPMQVYNLLKSEEGRKRLKAIKHLIIGGGAIDEAMAQELKTFPNAVWSTYGMTETLSHIALRRLSGPEASEWYVPFEGVSLSLTEEGCLVIDAPAVHDGPLVTNDMAELTDQGFRILGRKDNVICSGGVKIQMEEVERLLRPYLSEPFMISKRPDEKFGEQVVLLTESMDIEAIKDVCQRVLPKYWQPRCYLHVDALPMTETGKPARHLAQQLCLNR